MICESTFCSPDRLTTTSNFRLEDPKSVLNFLLTLHFAKLIMEIMELRNHTQQNTMKSRE